MYETEMCKVEDRERDIDIDTDKKNNNKRRFVIVGAMGFKKLSEIRVEKLRNSIVNAKSPKMKMWLIRGMTTVLLWTCFVQLTALSGGSSWGPRVLKGWPSCFTQDFNSNSAALDVKFLHNLPAKVLPPKS